MDPVNQIINQITSLFGCTPFCGSPSTPREWKLTVLKGTHNADKSSSPMPSSPISLCSSARATGTHWWFHGQTGLSQWACPKNLRVCPLASSFHSLLSEGPNLKLHPQTQWPVPFLYVYLSCTTTMISYIHFLIYAYCLSPRKMEASWKRCFASFAHTVPVPSMMPGPQLTSDE